MSADDLIAVPVDRGNLESILRLSTSPDQEAFVANNAVSIAQGSFADGVTMCGLMWRGELVGFFSTIDSRAASEDPHSFTPGCGYLWRFMIDARFQGKGLGQRALGLVFDTAVADGFEGLTLTAVSDAPGSPVPFYEKQGFTLTGRILEGEVELVKWVRS